MLCATQKVNFIARLNLKCLDKFHGWVSHSKTGEKLYIVHMPQTVFKVQPTRSSSFNPSDFYLCEPLQPPPRAFKPNWIWRDVLQMHFVCLSKHSQLLLDLWECATCPDKLVPCVHRFKRKISGAFVMNCDLLDNKNTTAVKFGTCVSNLLCQSQIECHIVKLFIV